MEEELPVALSALQAGAMKIIAGDII